MRINLYFRFLLLLVLPVFTQLSLQAQTSVEKVPVGTGQISSVTETSESRRYAPWIANLRSGDPDRRFFAYRSLRWIESDYIPILLEALRDPDPTVRRIAAEIIEKTYTVFPLPNFDNRSSESRWRNRKDLYWFQENHPDHVSSVVSALIDALKDDFEEVRAYAVITLFKLSPFAHEACEGLESLSDDSSPIVRYWAKKALDEIRVKRWRSLRLLARKLREEGYKKETLTRIERDALVMTIKSAPCWDWPFSDPIDGYMGGNLIKKTDVCIWPEKSDQRWEAADELIQSNFDELVEEAESTDYEAATEAIEVLDLLEKVLDRRLWILARFVDEDFYPCCGPAAEEMIRLGEVAFPVLAYEYLRPFRCPIGLSSYDEVRKILQKSGAAALPIFVKGLEHWRWHEVCPASAAIQDMGPDGLPVLRELLKDSADSVRKAAAQAIHELTKKGD